MAQKPRIQGSWLDFQHQNPHDGDYWNSTTKAFSPAQWRGKIGEMAQLGLEYLVIMSSSLDSKSFYPSSWMTQHELATSDPIQEVLNAAELHGLKVFVSCGFYGHTTEETSDAADYLEWHIHLANELHSRYGDHTAFYGWYVPNEAEIEGHYSEGIMKFLTAICPHLFSLSAKRILIAPYGTRKVKEDSAFVEQLVTLGKAGVDFIAYQDEVGVRKTVVSELDAIYAKLYRLHKAAQALTSDAPVLWVDTEIFEFEGGTYTSALIPASIGRITSQLDAVAPYVETVLCYQTHGLMNPPNSPQFCGCADTVKLWNDYMKYAELK